MKRHFLTLCDCTRDDLEVLFDLTDQLKNDRSLRPLKGASVAMIFQKPSLRTRVSFEVGITQLGGHGVVLSQEGIGIGARETPKDIARLLSRYCDGIVARLNEHEVLLELARHASVPVVNALTDRSHPCQVLADAYTIRCHGRWKPGVKVAFVGDGNNVANSWLELAVLYPLSFVLAAPEGFYPDETIVQKVRDEGAGTVEIVRDPADAVRGADVIYTDVWISMGQEKEAAKRKAAFAGYQVTRELLAAAGSECLVMHCLPAHRGEEITDDVIEGVQSVVFDEAENRLHVQKALLAHLLELNGVRSSQPIAARQ